jgi:hypothetical protein
MLLAVTQAALKQNILDLLNSGINKKKREVQEIQLSQEQATILRYQTGSIP